VFGSAERACYAEWFYQNASGAIGFIQFREKWELYSCIAFLQQLFETAGRPKTLCMSSSRMRVEVEE